MPRDRFRHIWVLHAKSVPRNGLRERRDLERDADESRSPLPRRAIDPFQQDESVGRMHMRGATRCAIYYRLSDRLEPTKGNGWCSNAPKRSRTAIEKVRRCAECVRW